MAGVEAGIGAAPSFAASTMGEMHGGGASFAPLGDVAPALHGEMTSHVSLLDSFASYDPGMDASMIGFGGQATPFDTSALQSTPSADIFSQVAAVATKAWENPVASISHQTPVQEITTPYDVVTEAVQVVKQAENAFAQNQAQQIALYAALFGVPVTAPEVVEEVTIPVSEPAVRSVPEIFTAPQIARAEAHAEHVVEAVAKEVSTETRSAEQIGRESDAKLTEAVEGLARSLGLEQLANEMVDVKASAVQQEAITVEPQAEGEVSTEPSVQRDAVASTYVATKGEPRSMQRLPEEEEQAVAEDQVPQDAVQRDETRKPEGVLVDEGPMKAAETNERRRGIAREVVEKATEQLDTKGKISGAALAREFRERANAQALSPILNGQGPDGSVDYIVAPLEGQTFEDTDTAATVLQGGVSAYTAVTMGRRKDASPDDVARVYGGSRRGVLVAA